MYKSPNSQLIEEARSVIILLASGKKEEAAHFIDTVEMKLANKDIVPSDVDVVALWDQVKIAASNPLDKKYLEQVKDELNRVTFSFSEATK